MKVKPLDWRPVRDGFGGFAGNVQYRFVKHGWGGPQYGFDIYPTIEAAIAKAQSDHEEYILNAMDAAK